jgi:hypothetical protein
MASHPFHKIDLQRSSRTAPTTATRLRIRAVLSLLPTSPSFETLLFQSYLPVFISLAQFFHSPPHLRFVDGDPFPVSNDPPLVFEAVRPYLVRFLGGRIRSR